MYYWLAHCIQQPSFWRQNCARMPTAKYWNVYDMSCFHFLPRRKKGSHATFPFFLYFCSKVQRYQFWIPRDDPFVIAVGVWLTEILMTKYYKSCYCLTLDATTTRSIKSTGLPLNNSWWNRKGPTTSSYERRFLLFFLNQQCNGKKSWSNYIKSNTVFENRPKSRN